MRLIIVLSLWVLALIQVKSTSAVYYWKPYWRQEPNPKRSNSEEFNLPEDEVDLCVSNPMEGIINMKRMIIDAGSQNQQLVTSRGKREEEVAMPQWRLMEWARQLHDLERYLAFCNRRNNVSKIRLL